MDTRIGRSGSPSAVEDLVDLFAGLASDQGVEPLPGLDFAVGLLYTQPVVTIAVMKCNFTTTFLCSLAVLMVFQSGAVDFSLCLCTDGTIGVDTAGDSGCCGDEQPAQPQERVVAQNGATCAECIVIAFPSDDAAPALAPGMANEQRSPLAPALSYGASAFMVPYIAPCVRDQSRVEAPVSPSRTIVLRR